MVVYYLSVEFPQSTFITMGFCLARPTYLDILKLGNGATFEPTPCITIESTSRGVRHKTWGIMRVGIAQ